MKKIAVTGGLGYIGSHTVVELQNEGFEVVIIDDLSNSEIAVLAGIEKITGKKPAFETIDVCDTEKLRACFKKHSHIDAVIHFAAYKAVGESVAKALEYYRNNVCGLISLLTVMREFECANIVFSSSCTVYGQPDVLPVTELSPIKKAESPYGSTKQMSEDIITDTVAAEKSLSAILLRYFNPIGAHPSALIGELPKGVPNNLLPYITQTAAGLRTELHVFGNDYNTPDGSCIRDYIYVLDLAQAHVVALQRMLGSKESGSLEIFNIGTGKGLSVLEILHEFMQANGVNVPYKIVGRRAGDIEQIWAETTRANEVLGWRAHTPLNEVLQSAWKWEQKLRG
ncbi:MAG: UDP-glucose 4-epimerase GalE [Bacteroidales bacterium]|jgi:UDP-glucose 4-epimerase|nr:UDP-glucose 4-epimerase GalE [Bacteroidales bacterium]